VCHVPLLFREKEANDCLQDRHQAGS
jgi:hypothetical protein